MKNKIIAGAVMVVAIIVAVILLWPKASKKVSETNPVDSGNAAKLEQTAMRQYLAGHLRINIEKFLEFKEAKRNVLPNAKESITAFYSFLYPPMDINYFLNDSLSKSKIEFRLAQDESQNRYEVKLNEKQSYAITVPQKGTGATIEYLELK